MTATTAAPLTVEQAQAELRQAEAALQALHERLSRGDTSITPAAFEKAESAVRFHRARLVGAERHAEALAEQARLERLEQLRQTLPPTLDPAPVEGARQALETAIHGWVAACRAYQNQLDDARDLLTDASLHPLPGWFGLGQQMGSLRVDGQTYRPEGPQRVIRDIAEAAVRQFYGSRQIFDLSRPPD